MRGLGEGVREAVCYIFTTIFRRMVEAMAIVGAMARQLRKKQLFLFPLSYVFSWRLTKA